MAFDFDEIKNKVTKGVEDLKDNETLKKVADKAKDIDFEDVKDKSMDLLEDAKKTFRRASEEVGNQIDKLKR